MNWASENVQKALLNLISELEKGDCRLESITFSRPLKPQKLASYYGVEIWEKPSASGS